MRFYLWIPGTFMITILDLINAFLFILQSNSSRRGVNRKSRRWSQTGKSFGFAPSETRSHCAVLRKEVTWSVKRGIVTGQSHVVLFLVLGTDYLSVLTLWGFSHLVHLQSVSYISIKSLLKNTNNKQLQLVSYGHSMAKCWNLFNLVF